MNNYRQIYAIKAQNEGRIKAICPSITNDSGIYVFTRIDENGIKYAYVGQAKHLLERTAAHLSGYQQHIDRSLKKHGLYDKEKTPNGWKLLFVKSPELNSAERAFIKTYHEDGYQLLNETLGGQDEGKQGIVDKFKKGYLQGKHDGYKKAVKEIGAMISKYTNGFTSKGGAIADRKTAELIDMLKEV
jgi:hypothetical protein